CRYVFSRGSFRHSIGVHTLLVFVLIPHNFSITQGVIWGFCPAHTRGWIVAGIINCFTCF
ncbi:MAG TPA: hypothetical protein PLM47_10035, partial [Smithellaceae bacterium]|nr:hypothetical protein [Smithellaceae bacterium]